MIYKFAVMKHILTISVFRFYFLLENLNILESEGEMDLKTLLLS